jgi:hypothetical protein
MNVPNSDHISRLCAEKYFDKGKIKPGAFMLRKDDEYLSVNWLECLKCSNRDEEIGAIGSVLRKKLEFKSAKIVVINVGVMVNKVFSEAPDLRTLTVKHKPEVKENKKGEIVEDKSHSGIYGYSCEDDLIARLISQTVTVGEIYQA